jgi:formylglycine-generating enzyme required for sulfatase activity
MRIVKTLALFFFFFVTLAAVVFGQSDGQDCCGTALRKAKEKFSAGDYKGALDKYKLAKKCPNASNCSASIAAGIAACTKKLSGAPPQILVDADGDGYSDKVDKCPRVYSRCCDGCPAPPPPPPVRSGSYTERVNDVSFEMVSVEGGTFQMGSNSGEGNERPVHGVSLSSFSIGKTEVTQALWQAVMGANPSGFKGDTRPVENVSWEDCQLFVEKLSRLTGKRYRLPTEAEWEYAARGGNKSRGYTYSGSDNLDGVAWSRSNSGTETHAVGQKQANELGLYDMSGNVWEWCSDWFKGYPGSSGVTDYTGSYRVDRGGGWFINAQYCRSAYRTCYSPSYRDFHLGFRLVSQ